MRAPRLIVFALATACARPPLPAPEPVLASPPPEVGLPPVPLRDGALEIRVVYPPARAVVDAVDSSFIFGSVGSGRARLTINDLPVRVWPNGTWLAWVPFPAESVMTFTLEARRGEEVSRLVHEVRRASRFIPTGPLWIDTTSFSPRGRVWWPAEEPVPLSVRAAEGASVRLVLPDAGSVPLTPVPTVDTVPQGIRAFDRDPANLRPMERNDRYAGALRGVRIGPPLGSPVGSDPPSSDPSTWPLLEAVKGTDTLRVQWPLAVTPLVEPFPLVALDDDLERRGGSDAMTPGRALPEGTYHWFFPTGTRAAVRGRINGDLRLALSATSEAWISAREAVALGEGVALPRAVVGSVTATPVSETRATVRIPLSYRVPFRVEETESTVVLRLHHAAGDPNWIRYGETRGPLDRITWAQVTGDEVELRFELRRLVWGYRTRWEGADLLVDLRVAPVIDPAAPLQRLLVVVDPGHPPAGATGPSGLTEAEANLAIARQVGERLRAAGARVVLTHDDTQPLDLWPRVHLADSLDADVLVSIHNNALPDGVNPFTNHGSSVFYFHPRSLPLARAVQAALVERLGVSDLGVGRGDLALVRGTWLPSILTEGLFMMRPEQEAALRDPRGQGAYAEAVVRGLVRFLAGVAENPRPAVGRDRAGTSK
jgi:N-acetylmuramoyl-L-alanine amidase